MDRTRMIYVLKGMAIGMILSAALFFGAILIDGKTQEVTKDLSNERIESQARKLGMIYVTDLADSEMKEEAYIIHRARAIGMDFLDVSEGETKD